MLQKDKLENCYRQIRNITDFVPQIAVVLGSGFGDSADLTNIVSVVNYSDIEGFPVSTVAGHRGRFLFGYVDNVPVAFMQGRVHYYEGYSMQDVVLPLRLMRMMGAEKIILTCASGGINKQFDVGDIMMITGQISSFVPSPLVGENFDRLGTRFPDMTNVYDIKLQKKISDVAKKLSIKLKKGVYIQTSGPNFETPEEIKMYRRLGADAVAMSTACEATAARHAGMKVCGITCITNKAAGITKNPLSGNDVNIAMEKASQKCSLLIKEIIKAIADI